MAEEPAERPQETPEPPPGCPVCPLPLGDGERAAYGMHLRCRTGRRPGR